MPQSPFTAANFSTHLQASPQQQHFQQSFNKTASPNRHVSPYAQTPQQQHFQNQQSQSLPDSSQTMAAPVSLPSHSAQPKPQQQGTPANKPGAGMPTSPGQLQREREQVTLLLDINRELLQETLRLQEQGKGGLMTNPPPGQDGDGTKQMASKEYIEYVTQCAILGAYSIADGGLRTDACADCKPTCRTSPPLPIASRTQTSPCRLVRRL